MTSPALVIGAGLGYLAAGSLAVSGVGKIRTPQSARDAMRSAGLPSNDTLVRLLGAGESAVGFSCLVGATAGSFLGVAGLFAAFGVFVLVLVIRRPVAATCGCAGSRKMRPSVLHAIVNFAVVAVAAAVALVHPPTLLEIGRSLGWWSVPYFSQLALVGLALYWIFVLVPEALSSFERPPKAPEASRLPRPERERLALEMAGIGIGHPSLWQGRLPEDELSAVSISPTR